MKLTLKKKYISYHIGQSGAFFFLLGLSSFCMGLICVGIHPLAGYTVGLGYIYLWWRWSVNDVWFLK
jgi:hypothetical protein